MFPPVVPPPDSEPIVSLAPFKSRIAPDTSARTTALLSAIAAPSTRNVPALIVVVPVYVFVPVNVSLDPPAFVNPPPLPLITPA